MTTRVKISEFGIIQKALAFSVVAFYLTDENGANTGVKATLYQASTGTPSTENPQTLDADGKLVQDCWVEAAIMASISGLPGPTERSIKKIRENPLEFSLPVTSANFASESAQALYGDLSAVSAAAAAAAASAASALTQAGISTTQAGVSTAQAVISTAAAATATAQAAVATTQAGLASTSRIVADADVVLTHADVVLTHADVVLTHADVVTTATNATTSTTQATNAAASAVLAASTLTATSVTSNTIGTGSFNFTIQANKQFQPGQPIIASNGVNYISGFVTSYNSGTGALVISGAASNGSGTFTAWNISVAGIPGTSGTGAGTVTSISVVSANGFSGSVANPTTTPAITLTLTDVELAAIAGLVSAADRLPYFTGSGTAALATYTAVARTLDAQATQAAMRGTGLGSTTVGDAVFIAANAAAARTAIGTVIGTDVQAFDSELSALAGLTSAADKLPYFTGSGTASLASFTSVARTLVAQTTQALMRTTGLGSTTVGDAVIIAANAAAARTAIGTVIGTDVQAYDAELAALAGLTSAANTVPVFTGSGTAALVTLAASTLLGMGSSGNAAQITLGTGLQMSGAVLSTTNTSPLKAWLAYNIGTQAILGSSSNISSVVRNSTGNITINFSPNMADANYAVTGSTDSGGNAVLEVISATVAALNVQFHVTNTGSNYDASRASVMIAGN